MVASAAVVRATAPAGRAVRPTTAPAVVRVRRAPVTIAAAAQPGKAGLAVSGRRGRLRSAHATPAWPINQVDSRAAGDELAVAGLGGEEGAEHAGTEGDGHEGDGGQLGVVEERLAGIGWGRRHGVGGGRFGHERYGGAEVHEQLEEHDVQ